MACCKRGGLTNPPRQPRPGQPCPRCNYQQEFSVPISRVPPAALGNGRCRFASNGPRGRCVLFAASPQVAQPAGKPAYPIQAFPGSWSRITAMPCLLPRRQLIKHLMGHLLCENRSFDHYSVLPGGAEPAWTGTGGGPQARSTSTVQGLLRPGPSRRRTRTRPTRSSASTRCKPFRPDARMAYFEGQNHSYTPEQQAYDRGFADLFPPTPAHRQERGLFFGDPRTMHYGLLRRSNREIGIWNYAQHFSLNDNAYTDTYGPSTPGALEVVSGTTNGAQAIIGTASTIPDTQGGLTLIGDTDPACDTGSSSTSTARMTSKEHRRYPAGNAAHITWGGFMGGFDLDAHEQITGRVPAARRSALFRACSAREQDRLLRPAPQLVPVLRLHRESPPTHAPPRARHHRQHRSEGRRQCHAGAPRVRSSTTSTAP